MSRDAVAEKHNTMVNVIDAIIFRYHKVSGKDPIQYESKIQKDYPDYPKRMDDVSKEDYNEAVKNFFKLKGFKHIADFSPEEKNSIVEECTVNLIGKSNF